MGYCRNARRHRCRFGQDLRYASRLPHRFQYLIGTTFTRIQRFRIRGKRGQRGLTELDVVGDLEDRVPKRRSDFDVQPQHLSGCLAAWTRLVEGWLLYAMTGGGEYRPEQV